MKNLFTRGKKEICDTGGATVTRDAQGNLSAHWGFETGKGPSPFVIDLKLEKSIQRSVYIIDLAFKGLRHPYITQNYGLNGDEVRNLAVIPALDLGREHMKTVLYDEIRNDDKLFMSVGTFSPDFQDFDFGDVARKYLEFKPHKFWSRNKQAVKYERLEKLFGELCKEIQSIHPQIAKRIKDFSSEQPSEDFDPVRVMEFEDYVRDTVNANQTRPWLRAQLGSGLY